MKELSWQIMIDTQESQQLPTCKMHVNYNTVNVSLTLVTQLEGDRAPCKLF